MSSVVPSSLSSFNAAKEFLKLQLRPILKPRRFQAYCIGTAKSGTHSLAELFTTHYRASHEPEANNLIEMIVATRNGLVNEEELVKYVRERDKHLWLELNSSQLNYFLIDILIKEFPQAKFILTIRDCYSWLDSIINHQLSRPCGPNWQNIRDVRFKRDNIEYANEEEILAQRGLYTLDGYLSYWAEHNRKVLITVPEDRLLTIRTHEIATEIERIADFLGVSPDTLERGKAHSYKAKEKFDILSNIDSSFLEEKVNKYCNSLMDEFFPDFSSKRNL